MEKTFFPRLAKRSEVSRCPKCGTDEVTTHMLFDACELAMIAITDLCAEGGFTNDARTALTKLIEAVEAAKGER